jgi:predicted nucleic acid-binding protein
MRVVVDTGVFISALIRPRGAIGGILRLKYHIEPDDITVLINLMRLRGELVTRPQT